MTFLLQLGFIIIILGLVTSALVLIVNFVPLDAIESAINTAGPYLGTADQMLPVSTILLLVSSWVVMETSLFGYVILKWVWTKVPGLN